MKREEFDDLLKQLNEISNESFLCTGELIWDYLEGYKTPYKIVQKVKQLEYGYIRDVWDQKEVETETLSMIFCIDKDYYIEVKWCEPLYDYNNRIIQEVIPY